MANVLEMANRLFAAKRKTPDNFFIVLTARYY